ncbi:MAG: hypothetical protein U0350_02615 [Caldilineaceae bacterium]
MLLFIPTALAQSGPSFIPLWSFNGGGQSTDSRFTLVGTAGQFNAASATDGRFTVAGGVWSTPLTGTTGPNGFAIHLPLVARAEPPPPSAVWRRVGQSHLNAAVLALGGNQLFVGERKDSGYPGGLYHQSLATCVSVPSLIRIPGIESSVFGLDFNGVQGVAAAYDLGMFYTNDGLNWTLSPSSVLRPRSVVISSGAVYAGTQDQGLYLSENSGATWKQRNGEPIAINVMKIQVSTLWIGTDASGVWKLIAAGSTPVQQMGGLNNDASKKVWDFAFASDKTIYLATADGVYLGNGNTNSAWQPFDLQLKGLRTLEIVGNQLYAGVVNDATEGGHGGVWQHSLTGGAWQPVTSAGWNNGYTVRDLLYDASNCHGLLAATDDGVWLYR